MKVPLAEPDLSGREAEYVLECVQTGWISGKGKFVSKFEEEFAAYLGVEHAVAVCNGTAALHLAVRALDIGPGDEVIVPTFTMIACANAIRYVGARPVFVDSEPRTWNLDPGRVEEKITDRTRAIMVVHIYGHPADMGPILELAEEHGLYVIEDAAEAHGAEYKGRKVGTFGHLACFSFYANKIITTGEGGMVVTDDAELAERVRRLRDQGYNVKLRKWLIHDVVGYNYRMTNLQAAIGLAQLERVEELVEKRRRNASLYTSLLRNLPGITLPPEEPWAKNVFWMYTVLVDERAYGLGRDDLMRELEARGVDTRATFCPIHLQPPYKAEHGHESYPVAEDLGRRGLNLPSGNTLTEEQIRYVADCLREIHEVRSR